MMHSPERCRGLSPAGFLLALALVVSGPASPARAQIGGCTPDFGGAFVYVMETPLGDIPIELYPQMAPQTVQNFVDYADRGDYDGVLVHRSEAGFVIQGGGYRNQGGAYAAIPTDPPVPNEPCLSNTAGTVAMARVSGQPNSATSQWFVNLADNSLLDSVDGGFTAFGRVTGDGMSVVNAIAGLPSFDTLAYLQLPFNQIFRAFPVFALPVDPPGGYGCSRAAPVFGLFAESGGGFIPDTTRTGSLLVPILLDPQCSGSGATGPPAVPCDPQNGRVVYEIDLAAQLVVDNTPIPMSCAAVAESEDSWAARRAGTHAQLMAEEVTVTTVPEPSATCLRVAAVVLLGALHGRRSRRGAPPIG